MDSKHIVSSSITVLEALDRLNALPGDRMTLIPIDEQGRPIGTVTDGDIRRALLRGVALSAPISEAAYSNYRFITEGQTDIQQLKELRNRGITLIPILSEDGKLVDLLDLNSCKTQLPLRAIVMAGGKGERLRPATLTTPKPLLQIEGKAIIDYNIEALAAVGIKDITVTARYLADQIKSHFINPVAGVNVNVVEEDRPLGTIGSVTLCEPRSQYDATLVMNSDLLTTISFEEMYLRHLEKNADVTIAVIPYQVSVPYAILSIDDSTPDLVEGIEEKPSFSYYANAGIYIFSNRVLELLDAGKRTDATDLIQNAIDAHFSVTYFPIQGTWIDVGSPVDFRQAAELMRHHNSLENR